MANECKIFNFREFKVDLELFASRDKFSQAKNYI